MDMFPKKGTIRAGPASDSDMMTWAPVKSPFQVARASGIYTLHAPDGPVVSRGLDECNGHSGRAPVLGRRARCERLEA
jgi:hypothetical protein